MQKMENCYTLFLLWPLKAFSQVAREDRVDNAR